MCKNFVNHFNKYNQWYSFGLLLVITLLVVFLFLKVEELDLEIAKQTGESNAPNAVLMQKIREQKANENVMVDEAEVSGLIVEGMTEGDENTMPEDAMPESMPTDIIPEDISEDPVPAVE